MMRKYSIALLTAITTLTITPTIAQADTNNSYNYYINPEGQCNDNNTGKDKNNALCSLNVLSNKLEKEYQNGKARDDINVIFNSGSTYQKIIGKNNSKKDTFSFAPAAGHKVIFTTDSDKKAIIKGNPNTQSSENKIGMIISPNKNRGGSFIVENLEFRNLNDGLLLTGGVNMSDPHNFNTPRNGVISGKNAPIQDAIIRNNNFIDMGTKYAPGSVSVKGKNEELNYIGNGALRYWNTYNLTIDNNNFTNFYQKKNTSLAHVLYGYFSNNTNIVNNTFKNTNSSVVHGRMGNNWNVKNNKFVNTTGKDISTWYRSIKYSPRLNSNYDRNAECRVNPPQLSNNTKNNTNHNKTINNTTKNSNNSSSSSNFFSNVLQKIRNFFRKLDVFNLFHNSSSNSSLSSSFTRKNTENSNGITQGIYTSPENPWCNSRDRVFSPSTINYTSMNNGIRIDYNGATTNGKGKIIKNEIYATSNKIKEPILVTTVKGNDGNTTITNKKLKELGFKDKEEVSLSVVSVSDKGIKTSSTGNKFSFTIGDNFGSIKQHSVDVKN